MSSSSGSSGDSPVGAGTVEVIEPAGVVEVVDDDGCAVEVAVAQLVAGSAWGRFRSVFAGPDPDTGVVSEEELVRRLADAEGLVTQLMQRQSADLLALRRARLATQQCSAPDGHEPDACTRGCCDPDGWIALEVAQALALTERQVEARLDTAQRLARFGHLREAVRQGRVQAWTATRLAEHLTELGTLVSAERLERIEAATLAWLTDQPRTVGQVNARMRRLIVATRAEAGVDSPRRDARRRRVWVDPADRDGLGTLIARLPEPDALAVRAVLGALAADPTDAGDERTGEQRRADLLTALVTGVPAAYGCAGDVDLLVRSLGHLDVAVHVTIPADTLTGPTPTSGTGATSPGEVPGYGPIPAATARHLAAGATSCRALVYDPNTGRLLGLSTMLPPSATTPAGTTGADSGLSMRWLDGLPPAAGYTHPPVMERLVHARDLTCRAPGCTRAAARCDCDHVTPWPRGETTAANTCCLCRRHHRLKTHAPGWQTSLDEHGRLTWTTPTGRTLATDPHDYSSESEPPEADPSADSPNSSTDSASPEF